jgi:hypothetical protein
MSNVIDLIEKLGQDARLRYAARADVEQALRSAHIDSEISAALLAGNQRQLEALLGAQPNVCCSIDVPNSEELENEKPRKAKEEEKEKAA